MTREAKPSTATQRIGVDVGYSIAAATSTGELRGQDLEALQRRTKWRTYRRDANKPYRQGLNRVAKELVAAHPNTDFAVEELCFTGKKKRSKQYRTRLSRWAYQHLARRLEFLGLFECFKVVYRNPAYTSQTCSRCGHCDSRNRDGERFKCVECGFECHADVNAAVNINGGEAVVTYDRLAESSCSGRELPRRAYPGSIRPPPTRSAQALVG